MPLTYIAAFFGGVLALLSPCSAMVLPTFVAAASQNKYSLMKTILVFGSGLFLSLAPFAVGAIALSRILFLYRSLISSVVGYSLIGFGLLTLFGAHVPFPDVSAYVQKILGRRGGFVSIFVLGLVSGLGSSACVGPILGAILGLASTAANPLGSLSLMFVYALGILLPLVLLTLLYERFGMAKLGRLRSKNISIGHFSIPLTTFATALLLLVVGYVFVRYEGSLGFSTIFTRTGIMDLVFSIQDYLLVH